MSTSTAPVKKVSTKTVKQVKVKQEKKVVEPVIEVKIETPVSVETEEVPVQTETLETRIKNLNDLAINLTTIFRDSMKTIQTELKQIRLLHLKQIKENDKKNKTKKKRVSSGNSTPHGFAKPCKLSKVLTEFLGVSADTELSSPTVTKRIAEYVRENNLYTSENKSIFKCDNKLKTILGEPQFLVSNKKPELGNHHSFWNLQKTMKTNGHFIRS